MGDQVNPLLEDWAGPFGTPPLDRIQPAHFTSAYEAALAQHQAEIAHIADDPAPPGFANTAVALERSGKRLARVDAVFSTFAGSATNEALQAIELEMAPKLSAHWNGIYLNAALFQRLDAVWRRRAELGLNAESLRLLERIHLDFVRAGARLSGEDRARIDAISQRLATLSATFAQNVLVDEEDYVEPLSEEQVAGVPTSLREALAATARARNVDAPYAVTLSRSSIEPFLQSASDRALREKLFKAWVRRGANPGGHDNTAVMAETLKLRAEKAALLGYETYAAYKLADSMAGTPARARALLDKVWAPALKRAEKEREDLQTLVAEEGGNFALAPWDWRYYAEKLRQRRYAFDEDMLKPYLALDNVIAAAFDTATRLFGITFHPRADVRAYHPDVRVWDVRRGEKPVGLFYGDYFARPGKQGGAWMSSLRDQQSLDGDVLPLVLNNCNFVKADPALLSFDDARTVFHEFGHALHGLLSQVRYPRLSGTNVARDFVELPSQLYEHWLEEPEVLSRFARHWQTGEALPQSLMEKLEAARHFNQGFQTVEFLASAFLDMDFHSQKLENYDPAALEAATLVSIAMPDAIVPRHSAPHFGHIFSGEGYSAGYYAYLWSEVLDADGFGAFTEENNIFSPVIAKKLHDDIYSSGGTRDFTEAYRSFRGRDPEIEALLKGRGLETN
ncbi:MAG: M3 family metallopeptidase [Alphaproteobacteria bacterium]|nr:M3 family metallopeptidase [Alphaproteobacteria bacterium]